MPPLLKAINNLGLYCHITHVGSDEVYYISALDRIVPIVLYGENLRFIKGMVLDRLTLGLLKMYGEKLDELPELSPVDWYVDYRKLDMRHYTKLRLKVKYICAYDQISNITTITSKLLNEHQLVRQSFPGKLTESIYATVEEVTENHLYTLENYRLYRTVLTIDRLLEANKQYLGVRADGLPNDDVVKLIANGAIVHSCLNNAMVCLNNVHSKFGVAIRASEEQHQILHAIIPMQLYLELKLLLSTYTERDITGL